MPSKLLSLNFFPSFFPPQSGGEQKSFHLLAALSQTFDVVSLAPTYAGTRNEIVSFSPSHREFRFAKTHAYQEWHNAIRNQHLPVNGADIAVALSLQYHPDFMRELERQWADSDIVLLQHPCVLPAIRDLDRRGKRIVYLSHNCEFELASQNLGEAKGRDFLALVLQLELRLCSMADHIAVVSDADRLKMMALYGAAPQKFVLVPNGSVSRFADIPDLEAALGATQARRAMFVGSNWRPNVEAATFIVEKLAPQCPEMNFSIVGSVCRALSAERIPANVELEYEMEDTALGALMQCAHIALNPMRSGGGSNVKLADYLAHGMRIVTTPLGARGFPGTPANVHLAEIEAMARLLTDLSASAPSGRQRAEWRAQSMGSWDWTEMGRHLAEPLSAALPDETRLTRHVVLNEFPVRAADNGGEARISGLFSQAADDEFFVILSFGRGHFRVNILSDRLVCLEIPASQAQMAALADANRATYASVNDIVLPMTVERNESWLAVAEIVIGRSDTVVFSHPFMWPAYEHLVASRPFLHDSHNVETELKRDALETHPRRAELIAEVARQESAIALGAQVIAACSQADAEHFRRHGGRNVILAQNGVDLNAREDVCVEEALAHEGPLGSDEFFARTIYLVEEFDAVGAPDFLDTIYRCILKRPATGLDRDTVATAGDQWRERLLVSLIESEENRKRVYVMGAIARLGRRETVAVFLGSGHRPNLTAAQVLASAIAPRAVGVQFIILGQVGNSLDLASLPRNVFVAGFVGSRMKSLLLSRADIGVNPMVGGGGSNLKVPDYLLHGLPVVSSQFGGRGFALGEDEGFFTAGVEDFPARIEAIAQRYSAEPFDPEKALAALEENYAWEGISKRFLHAARKAIAPPLPIETLIVVEDASCLRYAPLGHVAQLIREVSAQRPSELIVQADPLSPGQALELTSALPRTLRRVSLAVRDREFFLGNSNRLQHDNVLPNFLDVISTSATDDEILAALSRYQVVAPFILSGAGNPVEAAHAWRFVTDDIVVALPPHSLFLIIAGKAHRPIEMEILAPGGRRVAVYPLSGSFEIRCHVDTPFARVRLRMIDPAFEIGSAVKAQFNRLAVDLGSVEREGDLWSSSGAALHQLGLPARRERLAYGQRMPALSQELLALLAERAAGAGSLMAIGSEDFAASVATEVRRADWKGDVTSFDGAFLTTSTDAETGRTPYRPAMDWAEIGLLHNVKERGYLAGRYVRPEPILLLTEQLNGEILRFAHALKRAVSACDPAQDVAILTARHSDVADLPERLQTALAAVSIVHPESDKATLAVLGAARFVIVRSEALPFARVPALLASLGVPGAVWRSGETRPEDPFEGLPTVSTVPEVLERLWRTKAGCRRASAA